MPGKKKENDKAVKEELENHTREYRIIINKAFMRKQRTKVNVLFRLANKSFRVRNKKV